MEKYGYIYVTSNLLNGKKYIGQKKGSFDIKYKGSGIMLLKSIKKYGKNNFKTDIIEWCFSKKELNDKEKYYISLNNATESNGYYNISAGGDGGNTYKGLSNDRLDEIKNKISKSALGKNNSNKGQYVGNLNPMFNKKHTRETKLQIAESIKKARKNGAKTGKHSWTLDMQNKRDKTLKSYDCYWEIKDIITGFTIKNFTKNKKFISFFFPDEYKKIDSIYYNELKRIGTLSIGNIIINYSKIYFDKISDEEKEFYLNVSSEYKKILYETQKERKRKKCIDYRKHN